MGSIPSIVIKKKAAAAREFWQPHAQVMHAGVRGASEVLYVTVAAQSPTGPAAAQETIFVSSSQRVRWARALYDFEALEDDELGFRTGEVVEVLDSSNPCWWTGFLNNKLGLFPANYVAPMMR